MFNSEPLTFEMIVDLLMGRSVQSELSQDLIDKWSGMFKQNSEIDLHRLVLKLLTDGVLDE